jgi:RNA polymerase sigma factor (TIGR02999 family)
MDVPTHPDLLTPLPHTQPEPLDRLVPLMYDELRAIAHRRLAAGLPGGTLSTTALVHEAYLKLVDQSRTSWTDRAHFLALAATAMRHILVDRARARGALKRGGDGPRLSLDVEEIGVHDQPEAILELDAAMDQLTELEPRLARVVECRFFGGLDEEEIAAALGVSVRTVQRDWSKARMLLHRALAP